MLRGDDLIFVFCFFKYEVQKEELERKNSFLNLSLAFEVGPSGNINLEPRKQQLID